MSSHSKFRNHLAVAFACVIALHAAAVIAAPDPTAIQQADELEKRWCDFYLKNGAFQKAGEATDIARLNNRADLCRKTIQPDGRFSDLTYGPMVTGRDGGAGWGEQLLRASDMFTAWRLPGTKVSGEAEFATLCKAAIDCYVAAPYDHNNPWGFGHPYADLLESNRIGRICLFARADPNAFPQPDIERWAARIIKTDFVPSDDLAKQFQTVAKGFEGGANLLWSARGQIAGYLIQSDQVLRIRALDGYFKHAWDSMSVLSPKGPQGECGRLTIDGMLGEHDKPCMGSYGEWYLNDVIAYRDTLKGIKRWEMPPQLNKLWIDELLDSITYCYQGAIDPNLANPLHWLISRKGSNAKLREWLTSFEGFNYRDDQISSVLAWEPGNTPWPFPDRTVKRYFTIDFMVKHYPHWMASIRAVSERTGGMETFGNNGDRNAVQSVLLPLGTCFVHRDTREFQDMAGPIFTAMDYARLPGQTTRHVIGNQLADCWNRQPSGEYTRSVFGNTPFSNGVETAQTGVMGWWQSRFVSVDPNRASAEHKLTDISVDGRNATFFLEDAIVHLGAQFDTRHPTDHTFTNLEQRLSSRKNSVFAIGAKRQTFSPGQSMSDPNITWAWHDDVGYLPPQSGTKVIQDIEQDGDKLPDIASSKRQVFSFYTDFGNDNANLSFDWAVIPDITPDALAKLANDRPWKILSNTGQIQAIEVPARNWIGAVFHEAGSLNAGNHPITVSRPTVLIIIKDPEATHIYASDPFEKDGPLHVKVDGSEFILNMPAGDMRGSTVSAELSFEKAAPANGAATQPR